MFILVEDRKVWWPVAWNAPVDGGKSAEAKFDMQFVLIDTDRYDELETRARDVDDLTPEDLKIQGLAERKAELLSPLIADWKGVANPDKTPIEYSVEALARLLRQPRTFRAVLDAYSRCASGEAETRRKN
jgi:hypothetical protein